MKEENNIMSVNKELDVIKYDIDNIKNLIYTIRGKQVMLDSDVAKLYNCETRIINQAVKRNIDRFLLLNLKSQFVISSFLLHILSI